MPNECLPQLQACAIRVSRLEANGRTDAGANNLYVSDALVTWDVSVELTEGDEFEVKNACGATCVTYKDCDRIKRITITGELCTPDPQLHELMMGGAVLTDGAAVGYAFPELNASDCPNGVSVELWTKQIDSTGAQDADFPYAWWAFPRVYLTPSNRTFENGPLGNPFTGFGVENPNWFDGPMNDWPVDSDRVAQWIPTDTIPEALCSYQSIAVT